MLRSAAKNHRDVIVVCDPSDYDRVLESLASEEFSRALRRELACKVFNRTASYDRAIGEYLQKQAGEAPDLESISGLPGSLSNPPSFFVTETL